MEDLKTANPEPSHSNNGETIFEDLDSNCSTPYVSAPSSPGRGPISGFFYSAPASPMHFAITSASSHQTTTSSVPLGYEFEFSARFGSTGSAASGSMSSADELFLNGQIRPMKLSSHLERPQVLAPLLDLEEEDEEHEGETVVRGRDLRLRDKSVRRRTRSMSPLETTPSVSASSSRSSSAGRSSKRWVFLKDFLRSKSEGRSNNKFWSTISFSPANKDKKATNLQTPISKSCDTQRNGFSSSSKGSSHGNKPVTISS